MKRLSVLVGVLAFAGVVCAAGVVAKVQCLVRDPRNLKDAMGFEVGQRVSIVSLDDQTSDLDKNGDYVETSYPGILEFSDQSFALNQVSASPQVSRLQMQMTGSIGQPGGATLDIAIGQGSDRFVGSAHLDSCYRIQ